MQKFKKGSNYMVTKEEYKEGKYCKGMCIFCKDKDTCYQGIQTLKDNKDK